jgi:hypothetical protein
MPGFEPHHRELLLSLTFHLREAATIYQKTRKLTTVAFAGTELLHRMTQPALLWDTDRRVTVRNERARRYLTEKGDLLLVRDRLATLDKRANGELAVAFQTIVQDIPLGGAPRRQIIHLAGHRGESAVALSLTAFVPGESMYAGIGFSNAPFPCPRHPEYGRTVAAHSARRA